MARGIIGKMIRGAAEAGVPMLQEEHRAQIQTRRDEALNRISQQNRREDQTFQREMNADNQRFAAGQSELDRGQRRGEFAANQAAGAEERGMQREELGLKRQESELARQQLRQALEIGNFGIVKQRRLQGIQEILDNPQATQQEKDSAMGQWQNTITELKEKDPQLFSFLEVSGGEYGPNALIKTNRQTGSAERVNIDSLPVVGGQSSVFDDLPNPSSYNGRTVEDDVTGKRYRSNGSEWVEI